MWPKIIQVNSNDVYFTGGNDQKIGANMYDEYTVQKTTLHVSLKDSVITRKADMRHER